MSELDKYWVISANSFVQANEKISKFEKLGYKLMDIKPYNGIGGDCFMITMYLPTTPDLKNHELYENADIGSQRQAELEKQGYKAISNYSKHITWAKPRQPDTLRQELRDWLDNDGKLDTITAIIEDYV